jgi:hypothetical protein
MRNRFPVLLIAPVMALVAAPLITSSAAATTKPAATVVTHLRPVTAGGKLATGYTITRHLSHGNCETGSEATGNAYRCFTGKKVLDPCWVTDSKTVVDCLAEPWQTTLVQLKVTKGYLNYGGLGDSSFLPWGVQLTNGIKCLRVQGAAAPIDGMPETYDCHKSKTVLAGDVIKHGKVWKIASAKHTHSGWKQTGRVVLATAWFGQKSRKG